MGERLAGVAAIHPQNAQPGEPAQDPAQDHLRAIAFGGAGGGHGHAEHQPQGVHQPMAFAAFDPPGGIIANIATVTSRLHALAVQNRRRGPAAFGVGFPNEGARRVIEGRPLGVARPWPEHRVDGLPLQIEMPNVITRKLTLPGIGIECYLNMWMDGNARTTYAAFDIMLGTTSCDLTAGGLIKSQ